MARPGSGLPALSTTRAGLQDFAHAICGARADPGDNVTAPQRRTVAARACGILVAVVLAGGTLVALRPSGAAAAGSGARSRFTVPTTARQLIVVSSPGYDPPGYLASFRSFARATASCPMEAGLPGLADRDRFRRAPRRPARGRPRHPDRRVRLRTRHVRHVARSRWPARALPPPRLRGLVGRGPLQPRSTTASSTSPAALPRPSRPGPSPCGRRPRATGAIPTWPSSITTTTRRSPARTRRARASSCTPGWTPRQKAAWPSRSPSCSRVLRWLEPGDHPVIEIGTTAEVGRVPPLSS